MVDRISVKLGERVWVIKQYLLCVTLLQVAGLTVNALACGMRGPRFESHRGRVFIATSAAICSLGHGLHTFDAVPRSTQPSTLYGVVK